MASTGIHESIIENTQHVAFAFHYDSIIQLKPIDPHLQSTARCRSRGQTQPVPLEIFSGDIYRTIFIIAGVEELEFEFGIADRTGHGIGNFDLRLVTGRETCGALQGVENPVVDLGEHAADEFEGSVDNARDERGRDTPGGERLEIVQLSVVPIRQPADQLAHPSNPTSITYDEQRVCDDVRQTASLTVDYVAIEAEVPCMGFDIGTMDDLVLARAFGYLDVPPIVSGHADDIGAEPTKDRPGEVELVDSEQDCVVGHGIRELLLVMRLV